MRSVEMLVMLMLTLHSVLAFWPAPGQMPLAYRRLLFKIPPKIRAASRHAFGQAFGKLAWEQASRHFPVTEKVEPKINQIVSHPKVMVDTHIEPPAETFKGKLQSFRLALQNRKPAEFLEFIGNVKKLSPDQFRLVLRQYHANPRILRQAFEKLYSADGHDLGTLVNEVRYFGSQIASKQSALWYRELQPVYLWMDSILMKPRFLRGTGL